MRPGPVDVGKSHESENPPVTLVPTYPRRADSSRSASLGFSNLAQHVDSDLMLMGKRSHWHIGQLPTTTLLIKVETELHRMRTYRAQQRYCWEIEVVWQGRSQ